MGSLKVFAFSPGWGLPSTGPFALKLMCWLRMAGIDYECVYEDDTRKGPKGKNPWVEIDGETMGDTELIIDRLAAEHGVDLDAHLTQAQSAQALAIRRMVEEHTHQALEWELFVHDAGFALIADLIDQNLPWGLRGLVKKSMRGHFRKQLHARGIARHSRETIAAKGRADLDAVESLIEGPYLFGETPCTTDASVFGLTAPFVYAPAEAPLMQYAKTLPKLSAFCERMLDEWFAGEQLGNEVASAA